MADQKYPDLVSEKPHGVGFHEEASFEDALRDLVRNSPYLGISLLLHGVVLAIFMSMKTPAPVQIDKNKITATPDVIEEPIPPEPEEEPEIEEIEEVIEEPVISEDVVTDVTEVFDSSDVAEGNFEATGASDVIGVGGGGGGFGGRGKAGGRGGKAAGAPHQETVDNALKWLMNHQHPDGFWSCEGFEDECGKQGDDGFCGGRGSVHHDVGVTGLALLAFLGAGNTDKDGKYKDTVKAGLRFLLDVQQRNGNFAVNDIHTNTYDHFLAMLAVVEAYALTGAPRYKKAARNAFKYTYELRNPSAAWRYSDPNNEEMILYPNDVSVTGWVVMALTMAKDYDLDIDEVALEDALLFIDEMTDSGGRTGYYEPGGGSSRLEALVDDFPVEETEAMTAVGILCRIFADPELERTDIDNEGDIEKGVQLLLDMPIKWDEDTAPGRIDFYYWYYATYALYQWGGKPWNEWKKGISTIAERQVMEGEAKGSWDPQVAAWGGEGGRVYSTAILCLLMEVYYRYDNVLGNH